MSARVEDFLSAPAVPQSGGIFRTPTPLGLLRTFAHILVVFGPMVGYRRGEGPPWGVESPWTSSSCYIRREFLACCRLAAGGVFAGYRPQAVSPDLDLVIRAKMERDHIPGLAAATVRNRELIWADIDRRVPMTLDTLLNIGSIEPSWQLP